MTSTELPIACVPPVDQVGSRKYGDLRIWSEENQGKKQRILLKQGFKTGLVTNPRRRAAIATHRC